MKELRKLSELKGIRGEGNKGFGRGGRRKEKEIGFVGGKMGVWMDAEEIVNWKFVMEFGG